MASQESVDQLTQLMTQIQQTMLTMQTNITQLQTQQQNQSIQNPALLNDPQHEQPVLLNGPPVNRLSQINPLPNAILPQNQPDPMQDKLEKIESVLRKTGKIDGYLFNLKNLCPYQIGRASCRERV